MSLVRCNECGNNISSEAQACPSCGHPLLTKAQKSGCGFLIFCTIIVLAIALVGVLIGSNDTSKTTTTTAARPKVGDVWFVGDATLGCANRSDLERLGELQRQGDKDAAMLLLMDRASARACRLLQVNSTLYIENVGSSGPVCGRPRGEVNCLWVPPSGISERMFSVPAKTQR
jgi:DNA-directed RNA polymerase subunit RPC12/RpoP